MKKLLEKIHQSWLVVGLAVGIIIGTVLMFIVRWEFFSSPVWIGFVAVLFIVAFFRPNYLSLALMVAGGMIIASVRTGFDLAGEEYIRQFGGQTVEIVATIAEDPDVDESATSLRLKEISFGESEEAVSGVIFAKLNQEYRELERGDKVKLKGKMSEGFGSFSGAMYRPELIEAQKPEPRDFYLEMRNGFAERIEKYVPEEESKLALAYLLGMKNGLDDELLEVLRIIGLTHIVVASGTHLGILVGGAKKIFGKLSRFAGTFFSIIFIVIFGGIIGWTASITRAAIVTIAALSAWYVGRRFEAWRIIILSMAATLVINPMFATNVGWLLSFASYIGILLVAPKIKALFYGEKEKKYIDVMSGNVLGISEEERIIAADEGLGRKKKVVEKPAKVGKIAEIVIVTISAQLLCVPITLYYFGQISLISVVANVLILPTIPVVMGLTLATGALAFPIVGNILGWVVKILIDYHLVVMEFFAKQTMFVISVEAGNGWVFLLYIPLVIWLGVSAVRKVRRRKSILKNSLV